MNRFFFFGLLAAFGSVRCPASVILSISPTSPVPLGSMASLALNVSGLSSGTAVGTYDISIAFDASVLSYGSIVFGNQLDILGLGDIQTVTPGTGTVDIFELSLDSASDLNSLQAHAFTLATLTFDTLALATDSPITLSVNALGDAFGNPIAATLDNAAISVTSSTAVPEPTLVWAYIALPVALVARRTVRRSRR